MPNENIMAAISSHALKQSIRTIAYLYTRVYMAVWATPVAGAGCCTHFVDNFERRLVKSCGVSNFN